MTRYLNLIEECEVLAAANRATFAGPTRIPGGFQTSIGTLPDVPDKLWCGFGATVEKALRDLIATVRWDAAHPAKQQPVRTEPPPHQPFAPRA